MENNYQYVDSEYRYTNKNGVLYNLAKEALYNPNFNYTEFGTIKTQTII